VSRVVVDVFFIVHFSHYLSNTDCDSEYKSCVPSYCMTEREYTIQVEVAIEQN